MNVIFKLIVMNIYTHLEKLEKINAYAELIKYTKERAIPLAEENIMLYEKFDMFGHLDQVRIELKRKCQALTRIENRYKHLVSELYKISM